MLKRIVSCFLLVAVSATLSASDLEVLKVPNNSIKLDGKLTEPIWKKAPLASGFSRLSRLPYKDKPRETSFSMLADDEGIYLGIRCEDNDMANFKANVKLSDSPNRVWKDDVLELFFCPTGRDDIYYQFVLAAGGGLWSQYFAERGAVKPDPFRPYWKTAIFKGKDFWSVEVMIPWAAFYMTDSNKCKKEWLMNIGRQHAQSSRRLSSWSKLKYAFNSTQQFNKVSGFPIKPDKYDIHVKSVVPAITAKKGDVYIGKAIVAINSKSGAKGSYKLRLKVDGKNYLKDVTLDAKPKFVTIDDITYQKLGKNLVSIELLDTADKLVTGRYYPINVVYSPIVWQMEKPLYKKSFFPGQDPKRVIGAIKLNIPPEQLKIATVRTTITPDKLPQQTSTLKPVDGLAKFNFNLKSEKYAKATIKVDVLLSGKILFSSSLKIRNLPPKKGMDSLYVENGVMNVNGKPRFLLSFFATTWRVGAAFLEKHPKPGELCPEIDMKGMRYIILEMNRLVKGIEAKEGTKDIRPCDELMNKVRDLVLKNRDKNNFWFYYLEDEPECRSVSPIYLRHLYDLITELDPYHPVYIITRAPGRYIGCADVVSSHAYTNPVVDEDGKFSLSNPADYFRITSASFNKESPPDTMLSYCPQIFTYAFINNCAVYPRFDDSRASIWSAICNNVKAVNAYIYCGYTATADLQYGYNFIFKSIHTLGHYLTGGKTLPLKLSNKGGKIDAMLKELHSEMLLVVSNVLNNEPVSVTVSSDALKKVSSLHVFRENRDIAVKDGIITFNLKPFEVLLLTTAKEDTGLTTVMDLRNKLAKIAKSIKDRKNLLDGFRYKVDFSMSPMAWSGNSNSFIAYTLFDGDLDSPGLIATPKNNKKDGYFEVSFTKTIPKFSKLTLHHANINNLKVKILKYGEWLEPKIVKRSESKHKIELDFGKTLSTVKMRLEFDKLKRKRGYFYEIYELELFK